MYITSATFEPAPGALGPDWKVRIEVEGGDFVDAAVPVVAQVGDVEVKCLCLKVDRDGFAGLLRTVPPEGAELTVGYADSPLMSTGFRYQPPVSA